MTSIETKIKSTYTFEHIKGHVALSLTVSSRHGIRLQWSPMDLPHLPHIFSASFCAFVCVWTVSSFFSIQEEEEASLSVDIGERAIFRLSLFLASSFSEKKNPEENLIMLKAKR